MKFQRLSSRVLMPVTLTVALAFLGAGILAGQSGLERRDDRLSTSRFRDRAPRFTVELQLEEVGIHASFTEVTGLSSENEVVEYRDGSDPNVVRKLPGRLKFGDVTLKRGVTADASLWQWRRMVENGNITEARTTAKLILLDRGAPVATWHLVEAWPARISGPELNGEGNDVAIEEIVIAHEGLTRQ